MFTSPKIQSTKNFRNISNLSFRQRLLYGKPRRNNTGKEIDPETRLYYFGARYLDPKASRWLSGDPALGEYLPSAPVNDEARKRNGSLPGMGGVFNYVNLHVYHYAGNNPVGYVDPDGNELLSRRRLNNEEKLMIKEVLGENVGRVISALNIYVSVYSNLPSGRSISLPDGSVLLDYDVGNTTGSAYNRSVFMHEIFHQFQYYERPFTTWTSLEEEQIGFFFFRIDPYSCGSYLSVDLSTINKLDDIFTYEGRAQLVEEFTFFYFQYKNTGRLNNDTEMNAMREQARILKNQGFDSPAINMVLE